MKISLPLRLRAALIACVLALPILSTTSSYATSVVSIPTDAATPADAALLLATPTLGADAAYTLTEVDRSSAFHIEKYIFDESSMTLSSTIYDLIFLPQGDTTGNVTTSYFVWGFMSVGTRGLQPTLRPSTADVVVSSSQNQRLVSSTLTDGHITHSFFSLEDGTLNEGAALEHNNAALNLVIESDFVFNSLRRGTSTSDVNLYGGAISNRQTITSIKGNFLSNFIYGTNTDMLDDYTVDSFGGAIFNANAIGSIAGDFVSNVAEAHVTDYSFEIVTDDVGVARAYGGAINNDGRIDSITGDFIQNAASATARDVETTNGVNAYGGAISNFNTIGTISGDFHDNLVRAETNGSFSIGSGGAILNSIKIDTVTGDFVGNTVYSSSGVVANAFGGAIMNDSSTAQITNIIGDFVNNKVESETVGTLASSTGGALHNAGDITTMRGIYAQNSSMAKATSGAANAQSGALYNHLEGKINELTGVFFENKATASTNTGNASAQGGALYNVNTITTLKADFISNELEATVDEAGGAASTLGGALLNVGTVTLIEGDFVGNSASGQSLNDSANNGGAIANWGSLKQVQGDFIGNSVSGSATTRSNANGGAISNHSIIARLQGDFIGNSASTQFDIGGTANGGAIYNTTGASAGLLALSDSIEITGNTATVNGVTSSSGIYNDGIVRLNAYGEQRIVINDVIDGEDDVAFAHEISINNGLDGAKEAIDAQGAAFSTVHINNEVRDQNITVSAGILELGSYAGGSYEIAGTTHQVAASEALLVDSMLNIRSAAHVITKADYLGDNNNIITQDGELTLTGGTLNVDIDGVGTTNVIGEVTNDALFRTEHLMMSYTVAGASSQGGSVNSTLGGRLFLEADDLVELTINQTRPSGSFSWTLFTYKSGEDIISYDDLSAILSINGETLAESGYYLEKGTDGLSYTLVGSLSSSGGYESFGLSPNGIAGGLLLNHADAQSTGLGQDLNKVLDEVYALYTAGQTGAADALMAAAAGAGVTSLGSAMTSSQESQLRRMRSRMGGIAEVGKGSFWITAEGEYNDLGEDGTAAGHSLRSWGGSVGADYGIAENTSVSIGFTALYGDLNRQPLDGAEGSLDSYYLSAAAQHKRGAWIHQGVVSVALHDGSLDRHVSLANGGYSTTGDTTGYSVGVMYELGYEMQVNDSLTLTPIFNAALIHGSLDSYTESGSDAALHVGEMDNTYATFGLGARMEHESSSGVQFGARALFKVDAGNREQTARVAFQNVEGSSTVRGTDAGAFGVELGVGISIPIGEQGAIFLDGGVELRQDQQSTHGTLGYRLSF